MEQQICFSYTYSAPRNQEVLSIRKKYLPLGETKSKNHTHFRKEVITMTQNDSQFLVQKIRTQYTEKQHTELDALKALDAKVKRPANVFAYTYGLLSAIIMGTGMSLVMTEIGTIIGLVNAMIPGIVIGVVGMGMALTTYPIYKKLLSSRKRKYAPEILKLSEKLMNT